MSKRNLTIRELKYLADMPQDAREEHVKQHADEWDYKEIYRKIEGRKAIALVDKDSKAHTLWIAVKLNFEQWDPAYH